jgi:hypothetical protein
LQGPREHNRSPSPLDTDHPWPIAVVVDRHDLPHALANHRSSIRTPQRAAVMFDDALVSRWDSEGCYVGNLPTASAEDRRSHREREHTDRCDIEAA